MGTSELPGMWEESDLSGGETDADDSPYVAPGPDGRSMALVTDHAYDAGPTKGDRCLYNCGRPEAEHAETEYPPGKSKSKAVVRAADAAQYVREPIPEEQRGQIRVRLLNATPDPLGSIAALCEQYKGHVIRSLSEVTDEQRRACLSDMASTVLNGPLEAAQFHFQIEGVTRSITHQMVRSRPSFFAQESLRFAVPEGNWAREVPLPPSLSGARQKRSAAMEDSLKGLNFVEFDPQMLMLDEWEDAIIFLQSKYERLIELGMPAEEARGVLPHDMPTRIHWVVDLRTLLAEAGKRTCTQAQFPWRLIFAGIANELRSFGAKSDIRLRQQGQGLRALPSDGWQFREIANRLRPVCYQTGSCGFMAKFDRSCSIRSRVDANEKLGRPSSEWGTDSIRLDPSNPGQKYDGQGRVIARAINDAEWALDPGAARS